MITAAPINTHLSGTSPHTTKPISVAQTIAVYLTGAMSETSASRNASISMKWAPALKTPAATNQAAAVAVSGCQPKGAVVSPAAMTISVDQNRMPIEVSVRARCRVTMSLKALLKAHATGTSSAHSNVAAPGRTTMRTPAKPTRIETQRCTVTRSESSGPENAATNVGLTNTSVMTVASGNRLRLSTIRRLPATNNRPRVNCPGHQTIRKDPQPVTSITYGTITSSVAACLRHMTCPSGWDSTRYLETASFAVSNAAPRVAIATPLSVLVTARL